jgi:hypothetical protein
MGLRRRQNRKIHRGSAEDTEKRRIDNLCELSVSVVKIDLGTPPDI